MYVGFSYYDVIEALCLWLQMKLITIHLAN